MLVPLSFRKSVSFFHNKKSRREKRCATRLTNLAYSSEFDKFSWMGQK